MWGWRHRGALEETHQAGNDGDSRTEKITQPTPSPVCTRNFLHVFPFFFFFFCKCSFLEPF